jgi:hypothetical protein
MLLGSPLVRLIISKRPPYLEIAVTLAALAFLGFIVLGGFDQRSDEGTRTTMHAD